VKAFFEGMSFPRAVILLSFLASAGLAWFEFELDGQLEDYVRQETVDAPDVVRSIQENSIKLSQLQKQLDDEGLKGQKQLTNYAREIAQHDNVRLGQVNPQPLSPDNFAGGVVDKKVVIKPVDNDKGWSKQNIGNFMYMLEANSQQVRVTRVKMRPPSSQRSRPHEIPPDLWTYEVEITSRQREQP
jgi:hypothetical protein